MTEPELLERMVAASEGSRELDAALHVAIVKPEQYPDDLRYYRLPTPTMDHMEMCAPGTYWLKQRSGYSLHTAPHYTTDLTAITDLIERMFPSGRDDTRPVQRDRFGWCKKISQRFDWKWYVALYRVADGLRADGVAPTPALAACIALLRARALSQPKQGEG